MSSNLLRLHFLNVGHGDTTVIQFPSGHLTVVDINDSQLLDEDSAAELTEFYPVEVGDNRLSSAGAKALMTEKEGRYSKIIREWVTKAYTIELADPVGYLAEKFGREPVFRFILTHPDMDHLSGLTRLSSERTIVNFWDTTHNFSKSLNSKHKSFKAEDWETYQELRTGTSPKVIWNRRDASGDYWDQDHICVLSPTVELEEKAEKLNNPNLLSYVLMIKWGKSKIVLGGDANECVWTDILDHYGEDFLSGVDILKASHHGRDSGYYQPAVAAMQPEYTIVSVGKKPSTDASNKYRAYSKNVWSTRWKGNIVAVCDYYDGILNMECQFDR